MDLHHTTTDRKSLQVFLALFCLILLAGCATLPNVEKVVNETQKTDNPPTVVAAGRHLTPRESKVLIERLKQQTLPTDILERHVVVEEAISGQPLVAGNKVTLLVDGPATYAAMAKAIQKATDHVNFETFIFEADEIGHGFASLLLQKAAQGVQINLIYDALGSVETPSVFFEHLRHGGIQVLQFNPLNPLEASAEGFLTRRDHRKILIVDGSLAITGGINITSVYSSSLFDRDNEWNRQLSWRDTDVQIEGPAVAELQKLFLATWKKENGPPLAERNYFPPLKQAGPALVRVIGSSPGMMNRDTFMMYVTAIKSAVNSVHLTNSYFVPEEQTLKALTDAAKRGVDVKIILPAKNNIKLVLYAGRSYYQELLRSGVRLYEHRRAMLHAKTAVIDGVWSSVGSTNMDLWSFLRNDEVNAVILGRDFANQMESMFVDDLNHSDEIRLEAWQQRTFGERMKEAFSRLFRQWL